MTKQIKFIFLISLYICFFMHSCTKKEQGEDVVTSIKIKDTATKFIKGNSYKLIAEHSFSLLPAPEYKWSSSDTKIATINDDGLLRALEPGTTVITLSAPQIGLSDVWEIKIFDSPEE